MASTAEQSIIDRSLLEARLASLIGFDDISDIFDHLTSIDNPKDLHEYLTQLLGRNDGPVGRFCKNVEQWKKGEPLQNSDDATEEKKDDERKVVEIDYSVGATKGKTANRTGASSRPRKQKPSRGGRGGGRPVKDVRGGNKRVNNRTADRREPAKTNNVAKPAAVSRIPQENNGSLRKKSPPPLPAKSSVVAKIESTPTSEASAAVVVKDPPKPLIPQRGKAKIICNCFGTRHGALTNCLTCGRIQCRSEGYGYCPFCGYLIEAVSSSGSATMDKAMKHKERLLQFDRESAQRTVVYDDQEDYFSNSKSRWLTEEEQGVANEKERLRREELLGRKKHILNIAF
eukprot:CAMPEP_0172498388 /NCGR_PEP_ID=MMETSP1066-20121228/113217_1 /TAXON_ID=671091 /ORGANISM="Coscinodiscus wailesii, Strain CCMP2513" /LENGTH=342 /DNA_ID=CAMNT_0013271649 /DNA_START=73 /DNA_END=1101 /DNA_ORIENTATION=+